MFDKPQEIKITVTPRDMGGTCEAEIKVGETTVGFVGGSRHPDVVCQTAEEIIASVFKRRIEQLEMFPGVSVRSTFTEYDAEYDEDPSQA